MKVLLIHTDGYSIDVVGKYGIDPEWMKSSHCDNEEAILYINGEEVHVWQIVTA